MNHEPSVPDIVLERYRLRELPPRDVAHVEAMSGADPRLQARLAALDRGDAEFRDSGLAERLEQGARRRLAATETGAAGWRLGASWWLAAAAAIALLFIVVPRGVVRPDAPPASTSDDGDRIKGLQPALAVYRRTADGSETLADGAIAHPGDLLRLAYRAAGRSYGVILSIDGRGAVTVHMPDHADRAVPLRREATVLLDRSYELDDAPKWERFYFVTGGEPFAVAPIVDAARRLAAADRGSQAAALPLPPGLEQTRFTIQKETRP